MKTMQLIFARYIAVPLVIILFLLAQQAYADRLKDMASVAGVRSNQLIGYGLVVGLDGTGDKSPLTTQTFRNMMTQFGITIPPNIDPKAKNIAAVSVHADLPAFAKPGQKLDITVSSLVDAKGLRGGTLLVTPLKGLDNQVYAIAQGNLVVGGFGAGGADGSRITVNVPSVGRIPDGATVERSVPNAFAQGDSLTFNLHSHDFTTAKRVSDSINKLLGADSAFALDATSIRVSAPRDVSQRVAFLSVLENLEIEPAEARAKVIINSRTGTIVIGKHVKVAAAAITHGSLTVTISESLGVSQPNPLGEGDTVVVPASDLEIEEEVNPMFFFNPGTSLDAIVQAVNQVGAAPGDLMAILEALKQAGALKAEIVVI